MDEYLCLTLLARVGETEPEFKSRLSAFWSHLLRKQEGLFAKVYAEMTAFERNDDRISRKYLVEAEAAAELEAELKANRMEFEPIDADDVYSKFEAAPPEWFWIEH